MTSSHDSLGDAEHITHTHELLTHAARRAQDRPAYVAWALAQIQVREGLSDDALAARLGISTVDLPRLALCLRPRRDHWAEDLAQIATRGIVNLLRLIPSLGTRVRYSGPPCLLEGV